MKLYVTVIGLGNDLLVFRGFVERRKDINQVNRVNFGMLGNLKTLTYELDISRPKYMIARRELLNTLCLPGSPLMCLYEHGRADRVYILSKTSMRSEEDAPKTALYMEGE